MLCAYHSSGHLFLIIDQYRIILEFIVIFQVLKSEDIMDDMLVANICKVGDKEKIDRKNIVIIHKIQRQQRHPKHCPSRLRSPAS